MRRRRAMKPTNLLRSMKMWLGCPAPMTTVRIRQLMARINPRAQRRTIREMFFIPESKRHRQPSPKKRKDRP